MARNDFSGMLSGMERAWVCIERAEPASGVQEQECLVVADLISWGGTISAATAARAKARGKVLMQTGAWASVPRVKRLSIATNSAFHKSLELDWSDKDAAGAPRNDAGTARPALLRSWVVFTLSIQNSNETFCMLKHQRELTLPRPTAAPTASSSAYV